MNCELRPVAIVIAAGYSSRMGEFKPLLPIGELPAVTHVIRTLKEAGVRDIGVVTGHLRDRLSQVILSENVTEIYNPDYDKGMFSSILAGIRYFANSGISLSGALLSPVDCPLVPTATIKEMLNVAAFEVHRFIVPCYRGKKGHPLWIPEEAFREIESHDGHMGLKGVTSKYESEIIRLETEDEGVIMDMDTPEAYEKLLSLYNSGSNIGNFTQLSEGRRFILIRHGRTAQHREKIFMGQYDPPLDDIGIEQAIKASVQLKAHSPDIDKIYTSDLRRATQTAELIGQRLGILNLKYQLGLREMSLGEWDGRYISDIRQSYPEEYEKRGKNLLTYKTGGDGENFYDLQYRVLDCMTEILRHDKNSDIVIVTHSGVIRVLYGNLKGQDIKWAIDNINPSNGSVTVIEK